MKAANDTDFRPVRHVTIDDDAGLRDAAFAFIRENFIAYGFGWASGCLFTVSAAWVWSFFL